MKQFIRGDEFLSLRAKLRLPILGLMIVSLIISVTVFEIVTSQTRKNLLSRQTQADLQHVAKTLSSRTTVVEGAATILSQNGDIIAALQGQETGLALEILNGRAVLMRDRFGLDLIQIYNRFGLARTNLVIADLYQVSSLLAEIEPNTTAVLLVEDRLLLLSRLNVNEGAGSVIVGLDLETELRRIGVQGNLESDICLTPLDFASELICNSKRVAEPSENYFISEVPIQLGQTQISLSAGNDPGEMTQIVNSGRNVVIGSLVLITFLMVGLGERVIQAIAHPIRRFVAVSNEIARRDFGNERPHRRMVDRAKNPLAIGINDEIGQLAEAFDTMEAELQTLYSGLIQDLRASHAELQIAYEMTLKGWASALELRDVDTEKHTQRVTEMAVALAREMDLSEDEILHIRRGALLHDIGKLAISDKILRKTGPLGDDEWALMRQHPLYAYTMLREIPYLQKAAEIPYCHHENWDGSGYPRGLLRQEIPRSARIFAVADCWDALTSQRPYRDPWPKLKALKYIQSQAGIKYDPAVVEVFIEWMRRRGFVFEVSSVSLYPMELIQV